MAEAKKDLGVLKVLADSGDAAAQIALGDIYYYGTFAEKDYEKSVYWYTKAAEQGFASGQYNLAHAYRYGQGVEQDYEKSFFWYTKSAEQGNIKAWKRLGDCYANGQGVEKDLGMAARWYEKSAEQGYAFAQDCLGDCYYYGNGVEKDLAKAVRWYEKAAEQGNKDSQYSLGFCWSRGQGTRVDNEKAIYWFTKAAEQGHSGAQDQLGKTYQYGWGVPEDYEKARYWFEKAAEKRGAAYAAEIAKYYRKEGDSQKTAYWYKKAAELGDAESQYDIAVCYEAGSGIEKDQEKASYWYEKSAEQGYAFALGKIGDRYAEGIGVAQDDKKAFSWYKRAAENGISFEPLGYCYLWGKGVEKDYDQAVYWLSNNPTDEALGDLAICYKNGWGVKQDYTKAVELFIQSNEHGNAQSMLHFGKCLHYGLGLEKNLQLAGYWYEKAANMGLAEAQYTYSLWCVEMHHLYDPLDWMRKAAEQGYPQAQYMLGVWYANGADGKFEVEKSAEKSAYWLKKAAGQGVTAGTFARLDPMNPTGGSAAVSPEPEKNKAEREPVRICLIGNKECGKTTLAAAIARVAEFRISGNPVPAGQADANGSGDLRWSQIRSEDRLYSIADCPNAKSNMPMLTQALAEADGAVLLVDATMGIMVATKTALILCRQANIPRVIVFLNKTDLIDDPELIELVTMDIEDALEFPDYDDSPIIQGSAEKAAAAPYGDDGDRIMELLRALDSLVAPAREERADQ